ncbi:MAG: hypothetical protein NTZ78_10165 [Candidatus Aureabacteria bacterium]|nr:hypothetical protein [Candidatus Auribacterota bacterium]
MKTFRSIATHIASSSWGIVVEGVYIVLLLLLFYSIVLICSVLIH